MAWGSNSFGKGSIRKWAITAVSVCVVLVAAASLFTAHNQRWTGLVDVDDRESINGVYVGELGRAHSDTENVLGSLALLPSPSEEQKKPAKDRHLSAVAEALRHEQKQVAAMVSEEKNKLLRSAQPHQNFGSESLQVDRSWARSPLYTDSQSRHTSRPAGNEAAKIAQVVLSAIEPQLLRQQAEFSSLSKALVRPRRMQTLKVKEPASPAPEDERTFFKKLTKYVQGTIKRSTKAILNMVDYRMSNDVGAGGRDPGLGSEPTLDNFTSPASTAKTPLGWKHTAVSWHSRPWKHPRAKGGPCSVAGACDHGEFESHGNEHWRQHFLERYAWNASDPNKPPGALELEEHASGLHAKALVTDEVLLSHPIGETIVPAPEFQLDGIIGELHSSIPFLPSEDFVVAAGGSFEVKKRGVYSFCSAAGDSGILFVDGKKIVDNCTFASSGSSSADSGASQICGSISLSAGKHLLRTVVYKGSKATFAPTYSGADTQLKELPVKSVGGWVVRAYKSSPVTWLDWHSASCTKQKSALLGDDEVMRDFDDFLPPNDAYIHDQLTSGNYGYDHFGNLAPLSKENQILMYGNDFQNSYRQIMGKQLHSRGRGGQGLFSDKRSRLGDEQIDDDDREVPVTLAAGKFEGADHDHFDHWKWNSNLNQQLLNGRYWKSLKKDGMMDRLTATNEAYDQQSGTSHDRHPVHDLFAGTWNLGTGYGPTSAPHPAVDVFKLADRSLMSNFVGETMVPELDIQDLAPVAKVIPDLPQKALVITKSGPLVIRNSGSYTVCTSGSGSVVFIDREATIFSKGGGGNATCKRLNLLAGEHPLKVVIFQESPDAKFNATYSGPDTLFEESFLTTPIPGNPDWLLHAYASSSAAWSKWYWTYSNPDQALKEWMELHPEPWVKSRLETQGKNWRRKVFTGTHERMEDHLGVVSNNLQDHGASGGFTSNYF